MGGGLQSVCFTKGKSPHLVGGEDEDEVIKMSPVTDWILRHFTFNGQVEDRELTKENETAAERRQPGLWVGWNPGEDLFMPL